MRLPKFVLEIVGHMGSMLCVKNLRLWTGRTLQDTHKYTFLPYKSVQRPGTLQPVSNHHADNGTHALTHVLAIDGTVAFAEWQPERLSLNITNSGAINEPVSIAFEIAVRESVKQPEREPELVLEDVKDGYVTVDGARRDYGVVVNAAGLRYDDWSIDHAATKERRAKVRSGAGD